MTIFIIYIKKFLWENIYFNNYKIIFSNTRKTIDHIINLFTKIRRHIRHFLTCMEHVRRWTFSRTLDRLQKISRFSLFAFQPPSNSPPMLSASFLSFFLVLVASTSSSFLFNLFRRAPPGVTIVFKFRKRFSPADCDSPRAREAASLPLLLIHTRSTLSRAPFLQLLPPCQLACGKNFVFFLYFRKLYFRCVVRAFQKLCFFLFCDVFVVLFVANVRQFSHYFIKR